MIDLMEADAIYWFCDCDDDTYNEMNETIGKKIIEKKVKLYLHILDKRPRSLLVELAENAAAGCSGSDFKNNHFCATKRVCVKRFAFG